MSTAAHSGWRPHQSARVGSAPCSSRNFATSICPLVSGVARRMSYVCESFSCVIAPAVTRRLIAAGRSTWVYATTVTGLVDSARVVVRDVLATLEPSATSLALTIGICFGIYSSVFVAAAIAMWLGVKREDLVKSGSRKEDPNDPNAGAVV